MQNLHDINTLVFDQSVVCKGLLVLFPTLYLADQKVLKNIY